MTYKGMNGTDSLTLVLKTEGFTARVHCVIYGDNEQFFMEIINIKQSILQHDSTLYFSLITFSFYYFTISGADIRLC